MKNCNEIQQIIASLAFNPIEDKDILQHIASCQVCQQYQDTCNEMNQAMNKMSDFDADDALFESTLSSIVSLQEQNQQTIKPKRMLNTQWASGLAASFMLVSLIALFPYNSVSNYGLFSDNSSQVEMELVVSKEEKRAIKKRKEAIERKKVVKSSDFEFIDIEVADEVTTKYRRAPQKQAPPSSQRLSSVGAMSGSLSLESNQELNKGELNENLAKDFHDDLKKDLKQDLAYGKNSRRNRYVEPQKTASPKPKGIKLNEDGLGQALIMPYYQTKEEGQEQVVKKENYADVFRHKSSKSTTSSTTEQDQDEVVLDKVVTTGSRIKRSEITSNDQPVQENKPQAVLGGKLHKSKENYDNRQLGNDQSDNFSGRFDAKNKTKVVGDSLTPARESRSVQDGLVSEYEISKFEVGAGSLSPSTLERVLEEEIMPLEIPLSPAKQYLTQMHSIENLSYQNASGYWANTYLPGDSHMRLIAANLESNKTINMSNGISQNIQPFDSPNNSALAVYLNSDVANLQSQEPTRMRLQVGIQASDRKGGQRSAMNIGLVFDLSNKTPQYAASMKELLLALLKSKQPGDNISLTVAGVAGGLLIEPKDFRHGQIQVVINKLFTDTPSDAKPLNLTQALQQASNKLLKNDDPTATLGSSVLMLFTASNINNMVQIESMIHSNAVNGITLSTVSLGQNNHKQLKQLTLAGQGHARILQSGNNIKSEAKRVIDAELLASSRAVARAVRLRIRLAKGVKLIKVIDSYNLNEQQSQRVRQAEQSLDKRLSKNLGITADRGEDEEGIQIVIPSFFAGDTHVVLLDVVVKNAGPIADVSMRYKDLLYLRNAVTRKQLNLDNNAKALGPLQYNVMKNVLASRFANNLKKASEQVKKLDTKNALSILLSMQQLYQSMRTEFPFWKNDVEMLKDEKLMQLYINLLQSTSINDVQQSNYIIDSMQYISWRKQITLSQ